MDWFQTKWVAWMGLGAVTAVLGMSSPARAYEPAEAFVNALRAAEYYDVAIEYLDSLADNPAVPAQYKARIAYERGVTLVDGAASMGDPVIRDKWLDDGQKTLNDFLATEKDSPLALSARSTLGSLLLARASTRMEKSKKAQAAAKDTLVKEAREMLTEASKTFSTINSEVTERLKQYPASIDEKQDPKRFEERARFRSDFLKAQLLVAQCEESLADTYVKADAEHKKWLESAAEKYKKLYESHRNRPAGFIARQGQGRVMQKLERHKDAAGYLEEVLSQEGLIEGEEGRRFHVSTMVMFAKSLAADKRHREIVDKVIPFVKEARSSQEDRSPNFMEMRILSATACKALADELKAKDPKSPEIKKLLVEGRTLAQFASRNNGPFKEEGQKLLSSFTGVEVEATATAKVNPKNFAEAKTAGDEAIKRMSDESAMVAANTQAIANSADAAEKDRLTKELEDFKKSVTEAQTEAEQYYQSALQLAGSDADINDLNKIRYLLCYLSFQKQQYFDAAVLGEFVARRFPQAENARNCAELVMHSYVQLVRENTTEDNAWESEQVLSICKYMVQQWPGTPEADKGLANLIPLMIGANRLDEAEDYLNKIPADSDQRGAAELQLGQALWQHYSRGMREVKEWESGAKEAPMGVTPAARRQELTASMQKGKQILDAGVKRMMSASSAPAGLSTAILSLAQILIDTGEADRAVTIMEDANVGPIALVQKNDPSLEGKEWYPAEAYRTALRAYISALPTSKDPDGTLKKSDAMMDSLKKLLGDTPEGQKVLISNYVSLARDLKVQMELAEGESKAALGKGFEKFLERMSGESKDPGVLNWVAETYRGMGESFSVNGVSRKEGIPYFGKAAELYKKLLDAGKADPAYLKSPKMVQQLQYQLALTQRSQLKYTDAIDAFVAILSVTPNILEVQREAAKTYQMWGDLGQPDRYQDAMLGARKPAVSANPKAPPKNVIWGWAEIGKMAATTGRNKEELHEARYNLALCRHKSALAAKEPAKKTVTLKMAQRDVAISIGFYGDGGDNWRKKYDDLLKTIQKDLGEPQTGLAGLPARAAPKGAKANPAVGGASPAGAPAPGRSLQVIPVPGVKPASPPGGGKA